MFTIKVDHSLFAKISKGDFLVIDFETDGLDDYTKIWCVSIGEPNKRIKTYTGDDIPAALSRMKNRILVGHNILKFDQAVVNKLHPDIGMDTKNCIDTLVLSRLDFPARPGAHALAAWGERLGIPKIVHEDWTKLSPEMIERCEVDVKITLKVFARLGKLLKSMPLACEIEHAVAYQTWQCEQEGFPFNVERAIKDAAALEKKQAEVLTELQKMWPMRFKAAPERVYKVKPNKRSPFYGILDPGVPFSPIEYETFEGSREQAIDRLIKKYGWKPTVMTKAREPALDEEVLASLPHPEARLLETYYECESKLGFLKSRENKKRKTGWLDVVRSTGRIHTSINFCKAYTHRMSSSNPNLQNVPKDMREYWEAPEGWVLEGADASSLELRVMCHYVAPYDGGAWADEVVAGDAHTTNQTALGAYSRDTAKRLIYAMPYGGGDTTLGGIWLMDAYAAKAEPRFEALGIQPTKKKAEIGKAIKRLAIFGKLEQLKKDAGTIVSQRGYIILPDGRKVRVSPRQNYSIIATLCQSLGAVVVKAAIAMLPWLLHEKGLVYGPDYRFALDVHDEIQMFVRLEHVETVKAVAVAAFEATTELLNLKVPMSGEAKHGHLWSETH